MLQGKQRFPFSVWLCTTRWQPFVPKDDNRLYHKMTDHVPQDDRPYNRLYYKMTLVSRRCLFSLKCCNVLFPTMHLPYVSTFPPSNFESKRTRVTLSYKKVLEKGVGATESYSGLGSRSSTSHSQFYSERIHIASHSQFYLERNHLPTTCPPLFCIPFQLAMHIIPACWSHTALIRPYLELLYLCTVWHTQLLQVGGLGSKAQHLRWRYVWAPVMKRESTQVC